MSSPRMSSSSQESHVPAMEPGPGGSRHSRARVLVVEDEELVRRHLAAAIRNAGYDVTEARSGPHALELARGHGIPFDAVLSDVRMPGMTGPELVARLRASRPGLTVILMSGYPEGEILCGEGEAVTFLEKPFLPRYAAELVGRLLEGAREEGPPSQGA